MKIYRIRHKATGEYWQDGRQLNRIVKRIYYTMGSAKGALKSSSRMHKHSYLNTSTNQVVQQQLNVKDYEVVEYDLQEVAKHDF